MLRVHVTEDTWCKWRWLGVFEMGLVVSVARSLWEARPGWPVASRIDAQRGPSTLTAQRIAAHHRKPSSLSFAGSTV